MIPVAEFSEEDVFEAVENSRMQGHEGNAAVKIMLRNRQSNHAEKHGLTISYKRTGQTVRALKKRFDRMDGEGRWRGGTRPRRGTSTDGPTPSWLDREPARDAPSIPALNSKRRGRRLVEGGNDGRLYTKKGSFCICPSPVSPEPGPALAYSMVVRRVPIGRLV